ncbi:hypothetical protein [Nocardia noduli]|nr:hypothetical protein [Nocardia noduli]
MITPTRAQTRVLETVQNHSRALTARLTEAESVGTASVFRSAQASPW